MKTLPVFDFVGLNNVRYVCYRWYFPTRAVPYASGNGGRFHRWILEFKNGNPLAISLFGLVLCALWEGLLHKPDGFISIPPHRSHREAPSYPLRMIGEFGPKVDLWQNLSDRLIRTKTIPKATGQRRMRDSGIHLESMALLASLPDHINSVTIVDDVYTSGASMDAAAYVLLKAHPNLHITCFTFGKTQRKGSTPFPDEPLFPEIGQYDMQAFLQQI